MTETQSRFRSLNGKRKLLIIEDELVNREILSFIFSENYEVLLAETGAQALALLYDNRETLSIVLLDLILPDAHGLDILRQIKADPLLAGLPVIVTTADKDAEVESLNLGAIDFIPKPYPQPQVILARVRRIIELSEDRNLIRSTERDELTGLYNKEFFYSYAAQLDAYHPELGMDALLININHFRMINERYGKSYGDEVLRSIGRQLLQRFSREGIVCRPGSDSFLVYCPHRDSYGELLPQIASELDGHIRLRMGVYPDADKQIDIERRFDRAKMAADTVRNSYSQNVAVYDSALHEAELYAEQLLVDFPRALTERQFVVYYQPKFDIRPDLPLLASAEALVRWKHPELGLVSPAHFIPLFEENGLIQQLDRYVWRETARQQRAWKDELGFSVPVSVNMSRVDLFSPTLLDHLAALLEEFRLQPADFLLEITESAYTQDSAQMVRTVNRLREAGFRVEMDDFGSGYSSLNMLASLPVDAIKLDMMFLRGAFQSRKNLKLLRVVFDLADALRVPTIAEGVETAEQLLTLKSMGCDVAQGFFFSRPVPAEDFAAFLRERRAQEIAPVQTGGGDKALFSSGSFLYEALHDPETGLFNRGAFEVLLRDADMAHIALMMLSIDDYASLVPRYGQDVAAQLMRHAADTLRHSFRSVDFVCRTKCDTFTVIITRASSVMQQLVADKAAQLYYALQAGADGLPPLSLSVGVAFADRDAPRGDLYEDAQAAMQRSREQGPGSCVFA